ncbi:MAG: FG-GAP-like repeat-containing protein [Bacteroidia bacterium]|nr:FG-GAP-like repeat-containing protein [Bacteroidia bacterium]MCF8427481.1 FG-GAP-like repeat-containing protein [Bacteroidia bacterium]MCF8448092.1 FG-GAP-like repeat-containing protein [Bacteroidia bacterium]
MHTRLTNLLLVFCLVFLQQLTAQTPIITGFSPIAAHPRAVLTIYGSNLNAGTGARHVFIGRVKAQVLNVSSDSLQVRVPFGSTIGPVVLSANNKTVSSKLHFVPTYPANTSTPTNLNFWPTEGDVNIPQSGGRYDTGIKSADLDNDGNVDLITRVSYSQSIPANIIYNPFYYRMRIFKNTSGLTGGLSSSLTTAPFDFVADSSYTPGKYNRLYDFDLGDINSDGNMDIVARTDSGICIFLNKGIGIGYNMFNKILIQNPLLYSLPLTVNIRFALKLIDFDGNGKLDVLVTTPNSLVILSNNSTSTNLLASNFSINKILTVAPERPSWVIFSEDITNDGKPDILFYNTYPYLTTYDSMSYMENQFGLSSTILDSQAFGIATVVNFLAYPQGSLITDLNQDSLLDVITSFSVNKLGFQSNAGNPYFIFAQSTSINPTVVYQLFYASDMTGDGKVDLVTNGSTDILVHKNNNSILAPLDASLFNSVTYSRPLYGFDNMGPVCDIDKDGRPDLVGVKHTPISTIMSARLLVSRNTYNIQAPSVQTSSATVSHLYANSFRLTIQTPGNGTGRIILLKQGTAAITSNPVNYTYYAATQNFSTSPALADGSKIVYVGDTNVITISGLSPFTTYQIKIMEVNGWANATRFLTTGAYNTSTATLPVTWLNFEGEKQGNQIKLDWQTASEINSAWFEVERSYEGAEWEHAGKVKAAGNSNSISRYSFTDNHSGIEKPITDFVYYRLRQVDKDGSFSYSTTIQIQLHQPQLGEEQITYTAYPIPFGSGFTLSSNSNNYFSYELYNTFGQLQMKGEALSGSSELNTQSLSTGIYILHIRNAQNQLSTLKVCRE